MRMLGKKPKRTDKRTLKLARYLKRERLTLPPPALDWGMQSNYPMYLNDEIGDCTCASAAHQIITWNSASGNFAPDPSTKDVIAAYSAVSGYDPATGENDEGAVMLDVLNYWRKVGIGGHKITAYVEADRTNIVELELATHLFGGLYVGLALPLEADRQKVWDVTDAEFEGTATPGSWGGHAVHLDQYDAYGPVIRTWGKRQRMTWQWLLSYADEVYCCISTDWIGKSGLAPNGFDLVQLERDIKTVEQLARNE
jgi:hypothetical protein